MIDNTGPVMNGVFPIMFMQKNENQTNKRKN